jgi:hypothetical protein
MFESLSSFDWILDLIAYLWLVRGTFSKTLLKPILLF